MLTFMVDLARAVLFALSHVLGDSLGSAILLAAALLRLSVLPLTLRAARRALARPRAAPRTASGASVLAGLLQAPFALGLYGAIRAGLGLGVRFLWVANLARPDVWVAAGAAALVAGAAYLTARATHAPQALAPALAGIVVTFLFAARLSAALGLAWAGSALGNVAQGVMLLARPRVSSGGNRPALPTG